MSEYRVRVWKTVQDWKVEVEDEGVFQDEEMAIDFAKTFDTLRWEWCNVTDEDGNVLYDSREEMT